MVAERRHGSHPPHGYLPSTGKINANKLDTRSTTSPLLPGISPIFPTHDSTSLPTYLRTHASYCKKSPVTERSSSPAPPFARSNVSTAKRYACRMANILISNGTCYSAAGKKLHESFIPCGNSATGHQTCCGAGDNCLADLSCWGVHGTGYGSSLTYQAGCTDEKYEDASCPRKQFGKYLTPDDGFMEANVLTRISCRPAMDSPHPLR